MVCHRAAHVHRYHDGELSSTERRGVEAHLGDCAECRCMLADLRRLSSLILRASRADMPVDAVGRLQESGHGARDRGVLRVASWLTAAAAAVLIGALLGRPADRSDAGAQPTVWETIAVMPYSEVPDDASTDLVVVAQWMVDELSPGETPRNGDLR